VDKSVYVSLLFDFYGELLTEKQRQYIDLYYNDDLSLAEIAENEGISRQGVRDILLRAENTLLDTERKTGLAARHADLLRQIGEAEQLLGELISLSADSPRSGELTDCIRRLQAKLQEMKQ
jgi:predicted DNA-binding protein YlxM (UPF0122 family)